MKTPALCLIALAMSASAFAQTSPPAAPTLTAGAEFKGLRFDWNKVSGATWYQLEYRAHQTGSYVQQGDDLSATTTSAHFSFPLHLFDWTYARYRLAACNSAGCTRSASVSVSLLRRDAVGYFKAGQSKQGAQFGDASDLSPDGYNLVTTAPGEVTVGSDTTDGGAAYVFRRGSNGQWTQRVRFALKTHEVHAEPEPFVTLAVATSGSGNTVAVGMQAFEHQPYDGYSGEVDVYTWGTGGWLRTRLPRGLSYGFGASVALNEAGDILAVGTRDNDSSVQIYRYVNGAWQNVRKLSTTSLGYQEMCSHALLSRDGTTVAEICNDFGAATRPRREYVRVFSGTGWSVRTDVTLASPTSDDESYGHGGFALDRTGATIAVQFSAADRNIGEARVYRRGSGGYSQVITLTPGAWRSSSRRDLYGDALALSGDGQTLAVGDAGDNGLGSGPRAAPLISGADATGGAYVYRLSGTWKLANMAKPNYNPDPGETFRFGNRIALSQSGRTLIIPEPRENSSASGIDGNWANSSLPMSGAIFMY